MLQLRGKLAPNAAAVIAAAGSLTEAARRLGVDRSTVHRWIQHGRITAPNRARQRPSRLRRGPRTPEAWARAVRQLYVLSDTEQQLVDLAEDALRLSKDPSVSAGMRLRAARQFVDFVQRLDLPPEEEHGPVENTEPAAVRRWPRSVSTGSN